MKRRQHTEHDSNFVCEWLYVISSVTHCYGVIKLCQT